MVRAWWVVGLLGVAAVAVACGGSSAQPDTRPAVVQGPSASEPAVPEVEEEDAPLVEAEKELDEDIASSQADAPAPVDEPVDPPEIEVSDFLFLPPDATETAAGDVIVRNEVDPRTRPRWGTNWAMAIIGFDELDFTGAPRDGVKPLDTPFFTTVAAADLIYRADSPVIRFERNGDVRAYPLDIMVWHEIVNDVVGGEPVVVTFCPLCNMAIAFDARVGGQVLRMGTSGALRNSDLVMWDDATESLWQQIGGKALIGGYVGARLEPLPATIVSWDQFKASAADGLVLSRETGFTRNYGQTPYAGYDSVDRPPDLFRGELDARLSPFERVVTVEFQSGPVAYPFVLLEQVRVVEESRDGSEIVVFWTPGARSALDRFFIDNARQVGATGVFSRIVEGESLNFAVNPDDEDTFLDSVTGSVWNVFGEAVNGPLAGVRLDPILHVDHFWFSWVVFQPETEIVLEAGSPLAAPS